jgi:dTDP-4-dehydrorhamnose reductase
MRVLVFGRTGQVATELQRRAPAWAEVTALGRDAADLADARACADAVSGSGAAAIINAAAYTAVDAAEDDEALAQAVNGRAPGAMADAAARLGVPFLHISSDYVFDGSGTRPWQSEDPAAPLGAYGRTKLAGEESVRAAGGAHAILRTSWVFASHGTNFVRTMLRLSETRDTLRVVADQVGGPTPAAAIADALFVMARALAEDPARSGTYHFSGAPDASWADFAREIFRQAGRTTRVDEIATSEFPTPARRPLNSRLDCAALEPAFGIRRPDWRAGLTHVLNEMGVLA